MLCNLHRKVRFLHSETLSDSVKIPHIIIRWIGCRPSRWVCVSVFAFTCHFYMRPRAVVLEYVASLVKMCLRWFMGNVVRSRVSWFSLGSVAAPEIFCCRCYGGARRFTEGAMKLGWYHTCHMVLYYNTSPPYSLSSVYIFALKSVVGVHEKRYTNPLVLLSLGASEGTRT